METDQRYVLQAKHCKELSIYRNVSWLQDASHRETSILSPTNPYAASKAGAEYIVQSYYRYALYQRDPGKGVGRFILPSSMQFIQRTYYYH